MLKKLLLTSLLAGSCLMAGELSEALSGSYAGGNISWQSVEDADQSGGQLVYGYHASDYIDFEARGTYFSANDGVGDEWGASLFVKPFYKTDEIVENSKVYLLGGMTYYNFDDDKVSGDENFTASIGAGLSYAFGNTFQHEIYVDYVADIGNEPFDDDSQRVSIGYLYNF